MPPIKLMLADDHEIVRAGLRMLLGAQPDMEIVAEASSGGEAIELAQTHNKHSTFQRRMETHRCCKVNG